MAAQCAPTKDCFNNLIANGGFKLNCNPLPEETLYGNPFPPANPSCVDNWQIGQGTPHLYSLPGVLNTDPIVNQNFVAGLFARRIGQACGRESIGQTLATALNPNQLYHLNFISRTTNGLNINNPPLNYIVRIGGAITHSINFACNYDPFLTQSQTLLSGTVNSSNWSDQTVCSFAPSMNATTLLIETNPASGQEGILWLDNVQLWCDSELNVDVTANNTSGNTFQFNVQSSSPEVSAVSWTWNFGDGTTSTLQNPIKTFPGTGIYNVCVCIVDTRGCTINRCIEVNVVGDETTCNCPTGNGNVNLGITNQTTLLSATTIGAGQGYLNTAKCLSIKGTLLVNKNFKIDGGEIRMHPGSSIVVLNGNTFNLSFVNENGGVHGCVNMWRGIVALPTAQVNLRFSDIGDAESAVRLSSGSQLVSSVVELYNNHTGVLFDDAPFGSNVTADIQITGTEITSNSGSILLPFFGQINVPNGRGFAGIRARAFNLVDLSTDDFECNKLSNGIMGENSYFLLGQKITIDDMKPSITNAIPQGNGVYVTSNTNNLGYTPGVFSPFNDSGGGITQVKNVVNGILSEGSLIDIERGYFDLFRVGINMSRPNLRNLRVNGTVFERGQHQGFFLDMAKSPFGGISISENEIGIGNGAMQTFYNTQGIYLNNPNQLGATGDIEGNIIRMKPSNSGYSSLGILNLQVPNLNIRNNPITGYNNLVSGIVSSNVLSGTIECNDIRGTTTSSSLLQNSYGMYTTNSNGTIYSCNKVDNFTNGLWIAGFNMLEGMINTTQFKNHYVGLRYQDASTQTGDQEFTHNQWLASAPTGGFQAKHYGGLEAAIFSLYRVSNNTGFDPFPVDPSTDWFTQFNVSGQNCSGCSTPGLVPEYGRLDSNVVNGTFASVDGYPAIQWMAERELMKKLYEHPSLLASSTDATSFYNSRSNISAGQCERIYFLLCHKNDLTATQQNVSNYSKAKVPFWSDSLLMISYRLLTLTGIDSMNQALLKPAIKDSIFFHQSLQKVILDSIEIRSQLGIGAARQVFSQISPVEVWEKAEYFLLQTLLYRNIGALSQVVKDSLKFIASQCPGEYGQAVYESRSILDTLLMDPQCTPPMPRSMEKSKYISTYSLTPNIGATGFCKLKGQPTESELMIELISSSGMSVFSSKLDRFNGEEELRFGNLEAGLYVMRIIQGKQIETLKYIAQ